MGSCPVNCLTTPADYGLKPTARRFLPGARKGGNDLARYVIAWVPMLFIAMANGALRQFTFGKAMSELRAHQLSTAIGSVLIGLFIYVVIRTRPPSSAKQAAAIGVIWLTLTVIFEFAFGRLVIRRPWALLFEDYDLFAGRVWVLFLAWLTLSPYVFFRCRDAARQ